MKSIHSRSENPMQLDDYVDTCIDSLSSHVFNNRLVSYNYNLVALWGFKEGAKRASITLNDKYHKEINYYDFMNSTIRGRRLYHLKEILLKFKAEVIKL